MKTGFLKYGMNNFFLQSPNKKMVFVATLKNWSTTFRQLLASMQWQEVGYEQIDCEQQLLFGVLTDPYKRYIKGVVEDMMRTGIQHHLLETELLWETPPILGIHSIPLSFMLEDLYEETHWIPLDVKDINGVKLLSDLINKHTGQAIGTDLMTFNKSEKNQKQLNNEIEQLFTDASKHWFDILYPREYNVYKQCVDRYTGDIKV